ncbi:hypothetical protein BpHYR1_001006 [Brachionus plicatilis]|uniref:Uncharacterized protein n=1 Tax=Brachionus plicatilis TaxID=10195 RepID=A0A3M7PB21_BRAPC|nr:hypothetical protein BpHYR1_001006 [Brachionus plicatilis]
MGSTVLWIIFISNGLIINLDGIKDTIPLEIKNLPMGEKRKRGAPKKATKALVGIYRNILVKLAITILIEPTSSI